MIKIFSIFLDTRPFFEHFLKKMFFYPSKSWKHFCLILVKGFCPLLDSTQTASTPSIFLRNGDEQSSMYQISFSCSEAVAQRIIVGWLGSEFQTGNSSIKLQKWSCEVWSIILFQRRLENNYVTNHKTLLLKFKAVWEIKIFFVQMLQILVS